jgi:phenylpropionate dioxygenase-like ring-hydroxylating dioxygenase large terminal subunit
LARFFDRGTTIFFSVSQIVVVDLQGPSLPDAAREGSVKKDAERSSMASTMPVRMDWRLHPAEPTARRIVPPEERSDTLIPVERYISPDFARLEFERVFMHSWHMVCREQDLPDVGDYVEFELGDQSVLVVRAREDLVKAYYNSCLHRGMQIRKGRGSTTELRCGYHSWCWNLEGSLVEVKDPYDFHPALINPEATCLPEVRVESWGGWYFVNFDDTAQPLLQHFGPLAEALAPYRPENMVYSSHVRTVLPANWKTVIDNFGEVYHNAILHPQSLPYSDEVNEIAWNVGDHTIVDVPVMQPSPRLADRIDPIAQLETMMEVLVEFELVDANEKKILEDLRLTLPSNVDPDAVKNEFIKHRREKALTLGIGDLTDPQLLNDWDVHIFPNMLFNFMFDQVVGYVVHPNGLDPDSCLFELISLTHLMPGQPVPSVELEVVDDWRDYPWAEVILQDLRMFERMQRGLHSRKFPGMRFSTYKESGPRHTHATLDRWFERYG